MVILLNILFMKEYIRKMKLEDVKKIAFNKGIELSDEEAKKVYHYIKSNYHSFFYGSLSINDVINDARKILSKVNFDKLMNLYLQYKDSI